MATDRMLSEVLSDFARTLLTDFPIEQSRSPGRADRRNLARHGGRGDVDLGRERAV